MPKNRSSRDKRPNHFAKRQSDVARSAEEPELAAPATVAAPVEPLHVAPPQQTGPAATLTSAGDLQIAERSIVRESVCVNGRLVIGAAATLQSEVTAKSGADIGENVRIEGTLTVVGRLHWGRAATAASAVLEGPLVTEGDHVRLTSLIAPAGIHAGSATTVAVSR